MGLTRKASMHDARRDVMLVGQECQKTNPADDGMVNAEIQEHTGLSALCCGETSQLLSREKWPLQNR